MNRPIEFDCGQRVFIKYTARSFQKTLIPERKGFFPVLSDPSNTIPLGSPCEIVAVSLSATDNFQAKYLVKFADDGRCYVNHNDLSVEPIL